MSRRIELDADQQLLKIAFAYDRKLVDVVRTLPQRFFDRESKSWFVPAAHLEAVIGILHAHRFELGEGVAERLEQAGHDAEALAAEQARARRPLIDLELLPAGTWTLTQLNHKLHELLRDAFREEIWLAAEIQSFDRNRSRGHAFFELVHRPFTGADPAAKLRAVMWESDREVVEAKLSEDGGGVRLRDGLIVRVLCKVDFYTGQGSLQVAVRDIDLAYTSGTIHQQREAVYRRLQDDGVAGHNLALPWATCPLRVGLITSSGSDAHMDFMHELRESGLGFQVTLHHAQVQGARTESSVLRALAWFAARPAEFDVVVIVRGGGSRSDLAYFDTDAIGQAVCAHPVKLVVGVGHQRDQCLLDLIAHSEKTPTAAASALVQRVEAFITQRDHVFDQIMTRATHHIERTRGHLTALVGRGERAATQRVHAQGKRLERLSMHITSTTHARLTTTQRRFDALASALPTAARVAVRTERRRVDSAERRITPERLSRTTDAADARLTQLTARMERATSRQLERATERLESRQARLRLLDPRRILDRGFALVLDAQGAIVRDAAHTTADQEVRVRLAHGELTARVLTTADTHADTQGDDPT